MQTRHMTDRVFVGTMERTGDNYIAIRDLAGAHQWVVSATIRTDSAFRKALTVIDSQLAANPTCTQDQIRQALELARIRGAHWGLHR